MPQPHPSPVKSGFLRGKTQTQMCVKSSLGGSVGHLGLSYWSQGDCCHSFSHVWLFVIPWTAAHQASLSFTIFPSMLKLMSIESMMPSNHIIFYRPLLLLPSIFPNIRVFSNELALHIRWPCIGTSASASVLPTNIQGWFPLRFTGLILQSKGVSRVFSNTTVQKHRFFSTQPSLWSNSHNHAGKTIPLTRQNFVGKVMSAFYTLSRFVIAFLPSSKGLLISWL